MTSSPKGMVSSIFGSDDVRDVRYNDKQNAIEFLDKDKILGNCFDGQACFLVIKKSFK